MVNLLVKGEHNNPPTVEFQLKQDKDGDVRIYANNVCVAFFKASNGELWRVKVHKDHRSNVSGLSLWDDGYIKTL